MKKFEERMHKDSCWNKAKDDQYVFVMIDHDLAMPDTIRDWAARRVKLGLNKWEDPKIQSALEEALVIETQQRQAGLRAD